MLNWVYLVWKAKVPRPGFADHMPQTLCRLCLPTAAKIMLVAATNVETHPGLDIVATNPFTACISILCYRDALS